MKNTIGIFHCSLPMGPGKVVESLVLGLKELGIPCKINEIGHYNIVLQNHIILYKDIQIDNLFIGPNVFDIPIDSPQISMNYSAYEKILVASEWVKILYEKWIPSDKISIWNCGIDTNFFNTNNKNKEYDFLIYYKRRTQEELNIVTDFLLSKNKSFTTINYGNPEYSKEYFLDVISKSKYAFIINNSETGGIAMQEILSCNVPMLVWDINKWNDRGETLSCSATSIPYFNSLCGEKFYSANNLEFAYNKFMDAEYNPREYIIENCNYIEQTKKLLKIIQYS